MKLIQEFSDYILHQLNYSENTLDGYVRDVNKMLSSLERDPSDISEKDLTDYLISLGRSGISISSRNRALSSFKRYFDFLRGRGVIETNPAIGIAHGKREEKLPRPADLEDIHRIKNIADNLRDKVMIETLYATGARREELARIHISDINFTSYSLLIMGKGSKERYLPLYKSLINKFKELFESHGSQWLFPSSVNPNSHISTRRVNEIISKWVSVAGLTNKNITPHSFRHSFCTHLYQNGADIKTISDLAGHSSTGVTDIYTKVDNARNRSEFNKYHPWAERS